MSLNLKKTMEALKSVFIDNYECVNCCYVFNYPLSIYDIVNPYNNPHIFCCPHTLAMQEENTLQKRGKNDDTNKN